MNISVLCEFLGQILFYRHFMSTLKTMGLLKASDYD